MNRSLVRIALAIALAGVLIAFEWYRLRTESSKLPAAGMVSATPAGDCRPFAPPAIPAGAPRGFVDVTDELKLDFSHVVGPLGTYFMPESVGAGGAFFDYDGDGRLDLYLVNSGRSPDAVGDFPAGTRTENRLFRMTEEGVFADVTAESGLGDTGYGIGCAVGDFNNDGHPDVYVTNYGADQLYRNNGNGTFTNVTEAAGIHSAEWGTSATFLDYNRDGLLDLFVVNYTADPEHGHSIACGFHYGLVSYCGPHKFQPTVDRLFRNDGIVSDGAGGTVARFTDVTDEAGLSAATTYGFGVVCADLTGDGWIDLYVANDAAPNRLWVNQRDGRFVDEGVLRGVAFSGDGLPQGGMGAVAGDVDNDGFLDLAVTNLSQEAATLYLNQGNLTFDDATGRSGILEPTRIHTGWGAALVDLNHDGWLDFPIANGLVVPCHSRFPFHGEDKFVTRRDDVANPAAYWQDYADRNVLLRGVGSGRFLDCGTSAGDVTAAAGSARSMVTGDIDDDGDIDLLLTNCGGRARLYRNDLPKQGHWMSIRAFDPALNRDAIGAEVIVQTGSLNLLRVVATASGYLAGHDVRVHFGLGSESGYDRILVKWPDGAVESATEEFPGGDADRAIVLRRGTGRGAETLP